MTATPIPRTVTMTVYGDLDVSILDEMPRGRGKIITAVRDSSKLGEVLSFLRKQLEAGRRSEEHTSELQSHLNLVCRLLLEKKKTNTTPNYQQYTSTHTYN